MIVKNRKKGNKIRSDTITIIIIIIIISNIIRSDTSVPRQRPLRVLGNTLCSSVPRQVCSTNLNRFSFPRCFPSRELSVRVCTSIPQRQCRNVPRQRCLTTSRWGLHLRRFYLSFFGSERSPRNANVCPCVCLSVCVSLRHIML